MSNLDNGNFVVMVNLVFFIEDGEVKGLVVFFIVGNVYEFF